MLPAGRADWRKRRCLERCASRGSEAAAAWLAACLPPTVRSRTTAGLGEEYERAAEWVRTQMPVNASFDASVFESIIRVVGGTLAAYDLTGDKRMLERCAWGTWKACRDAGVAVNGRC